MSHPKEFLIRWSREYQNIFEEDIDQILKEIDNPVKVIEGPLMDGMKKGGPAFW